MALGAKYPVLLVGLVDVLTAGESQLLRQLSAMSYATGSTAAEQAAIDAKKSSDNAIAAALKEKAAVTGLSISSLARLPIILDGEIIPASMSNYSTLMVKQLSVFEGTNTTTQAANTVSIDIKTSRSAETAIFIDLLFSVADIIFSKSDIAPSVSFFGGSIAIPNGYLVRLSRRGGASSSEEVITLEIAKDLTFLFGAPQELAIGAEKAPVAIEPSANWQIGG